MTIVTEKEKFLAIQLWGDAQKFNDENHINRHNLFMQILAERYGYDWETHTLNPETGEIVKK